MGRKYFFQLTIKYKYYFKYFMKQNSKGKCFHWRILTLHEKLIVKFAKNVPQNRKA